VTISDEIAVLRDVTARLKEVGVQYMLSGSLALSFYATPRMTRDIDLVVDLRIADVDRVVSVLEPAYYVDAGLARRAAVDRGMFNAIHLEKAMKVDFVVRKDTPYRVEEFARRRRMQVDRDEFFVVSPEDLILSKLAWARDSRSELQRRDVKSLLRALPELDRPYLESRARDLGVFDLLVEWMP
jgi:hypothetical protein